MYEFTRNINIVERLKFRLRVITIPGNATTAAAVDTASFVLLARLGYCYCAERFAIVRLMSL